MKRRESIALTGALAVSSMVNARTLLAKPVAKSKAGTFHVATDPLGVSIQWRDKTVLRYRSQETTPPRPEIGPEYTRGGYVSELRTPLGRLVTDDFPPNHLHHHGVWFAWVKTAFGAKPRNPDFWNMGQKSGTVKFVTLEGVQADAHGVEIRTRHQHLDLSTSPPVEVGQETWRVFMHTPAASNPNLFLVDFDMSFVVTAPESLHILKHTYGGLGIRGHRDWNGAGAVRFLTSEGCGRPAGNETRVRWVDMMAHVEGTRAGVTVLGHPENFRAPQPVRLHPTEPFLSMAPAQLGDFELSTGQPYRSRYRLLVHDGELDPKTIESQWQAYRQP
jgi:Methane oxygenase PmoA